MRKIIRLILTALIFFGGSLILIILALFRPFSPKVAMMWGKYIPPIALKALGIKVKARNIHRLREYHPCVAIANHQHALDVLIIGQQFKVPTVTVGKKELFWVPFFGQIFWLTGQIFIDRKHRQNAMQTMGEVAKTLIQRNVSVWIFPEGTRSRRSGLLPFKKGAFYLAIQAQVPLVPVAISSYHKNINLYCENAGTVIVEVMDPISTKGLTMADVENLITDCHERMKRQIDMLDRELQQG